MFRDIQDTDRQEEVQMRARQLYGQCKTQARNVLDQRKLACKQRVKSQLETSMQSITQVRTNLYCVLLLSVVLFGLSLSSKGILHV